MTSGSVMKAAAGSPLLITPDLLVHDPARGRNVTLDWLTGDTWFLAPPLPPADRRAYGTGCGGSLPPPRMTASTPYLGNRALAIDVDDAPWGAVGMIGLATASAAHAVGGGCTLYLDPLNTPVGLPVLTSAHGFASINLPVPYEPVLHGALVFCQAFVLDAASPFSGLAMSNGLKLRLGH